MKKRFGFLLVLLFGSVANATETLQCTFDSYSMRDKSGNEEMIIKFLIDDDKAYMLGNGGSNQVVMFSGLAVSFVEVTGLKNITVTTVDDDKQAVHSRNSVGFDGLLIASQYYGSCVKGL